MNGIQINININININISGWWEGAQQNFYFFKQTIKV